MPRKKKAKGRPLPHNCVGCEKVQPQVNACQIRKYQFEALLLKCPREDIKK